MTQWQEIAHEDWDTSLYKKGGHFLQSSHWARFQQALKHQVFFGQSEGWQCLAIREQGKFGERFYCPYGPLVASREAFDDAVSSLKNLAEQQNVTFVRIEPTGNVQLEALKIAGMRQAAKDVQPRLTWVKDLSKTEEKLIAEMSATNRNLHRTAAKKGITFRDSHDPHDIQLFLTMIHDVARQTGIRPHNDHYYTTMADVLLPENAATLYIADYEGESIATAFVFDSDTTRYYAHAGALYEFRKLHPGSPLLSKMILDAKTNGQQWFDFVGVAPPDEPSHSWAGFTRFKQSFGGDYKSYLGTWELPIKRSAYQMYRASLRAANLLKRV